MSSGFDPYYDWLGIPPAESANGGPHHYRLLGLQVFESNPRVIENAADRLMVQLRSFAAGPNGKDSQKLLNEVAAARACLLDDDRRAAYDKPLRARLAAAAPKPQVTVQPIYVQVPVQVPVPVPTAMPPMPSAAPAPPPPAEANAGSGWPAAPQPAFAFSTSSSSRGRRRGGKEGAGSAVLGLVKIVLGGLGGLSIAVLGVWIFARSDPFGLFAPSPVTTMAAKPKQTNPAALSPTPAVKPDQVKSTAPVKPVPKTASPTNTPAEGTSQPGSTTPTPATPAAETKAPPEPLAATVPVSIEPPENPTVPLPMPAPAANTRHPAPTSEEQQAKLAELKEVYKADFDKGLKPAGREEYIEFLLGTSAKLQSDPTARFVLLREAYQRLTSAKEFATAAEIVDRLEQEFEMDPFKPRLHLLTEASAAARLPADRLAIVLCAAELVDQAIARQRIGEADKLVRMAEGQAKTLSDGKLRARMTALKLQVEKLADDWGPVERARAKLVTNPSDAEAALIDGRYRCLAEGDWKAGMALLALSSDQALATAARQDQAGPGDDITAAILADNWYELAQSDNSLKGFYARARHWYKQVMNTVEGLDQQRIQQRIKEIEALNLPQRLLEENPAAADAPLPSFYASYVRTQTFEPVDLMKFVTQQELRAAAWYAENANTLASQSDGSFARIPAHYAPPREYQVTIHVVRNSQSDQPAEVMNEGAFVAGLVGPKSQFIVAIDVPAGGEFASFISVAGGAGTQNPAATKAGPRQLPPNRSSVIVCEVRRRSVTVRVNDAEVCRYEGDMSNLALPKEWSVSDPRAPFIGSQNCRYLVSSWVIRPLPPEPRLSATVGGPSGAGGELNPNRLFGE